MLNLFQHLTRNNRFRNKFGMTYRHRLLNTTLVILTMKYFLLILVLSVTAAMLLWPNFHPEGAVLDRYYWQADVLIHTGYFFGITLFISLLKFDIKPAYLFLLLGLFSMGLELLQSFSYKRGVSLMDTTDNLIGIGLALITYIWLVKKRSLSNNEQ